MVWILSGQSIDRLRSFTPILFFVIISLFLDFLQYIWKSGVEYAIFIKREQKDKEEIVNIQDDGNTGEETSLLDIIKRRFFSLGKSGKKERQGVAENPPKALSKNDYPFPNWFPKITWGFWLTKVLSLAIAVLLLIIYLVRILFCNGYDQHSKVLETTECQCCCKVIGDSSNTNHTLPANAFLGYMKNSIEPKIDDLLKFTGDINGQIKAIYSPTTNNTSATIRTNINNTTKYSSKRSRVPNPKDTCCTIIYNNYYTLPQDSTNN